MADRWPLTGRDEELHLIADALADDDHMGVVIAGQAGVGKTRLARTATEAAAREGWTVRRVAGTATGRMITLGAFAPWVDDTGSTPESLARQVFAGLTSETDERPLLVLVDDAHLLDDLSALILHQLVMQGVARVIATIRTGEPAPDAVTALWKDELLGRLELQPLSEEEAGALLTAVLGGPVDADCRTRMFKLSGGNALYLRHLVGHELDSDRLTSADGEWRWSGTPLVSRSLVELVETEIGMVSNDVRDVVDLVAIAEPVDRGLLMSLVDADAVESAEERGLIAIAATDLVYVGHPLYGEVRLSQCGSMRLKRLRGRVAAAMAATNAADPLVVGMLWLESDLPPDADVLLRAAQIAGARLDLALAERFARVAVATQPNSEAKLALAYILITGARGPEAEAILDTLSAEDLAVTGVFDGVALRASNQLFSLGDPDAARALLDEVIGLGDEVRNHRLRTYRAVAEVMSAEPAAVVSTMAAVDYDHVHDFARLVGYAAETIALGDLGRTRDASTKAALGYRFLEESPTEAFHGSGLAEYDAYALLAAGYVDDAVAVAERENRRCSTLPDVPKSMAVAALGMTDLARGDLTSAVRHLDAVRLAFGDGEIYPPFHRFGILLAEALARSGNVGAAVESLERTRAGMTRGHAYVESGFLLAEAWVDAARNRPAEARAATVRAIEFACRHGQLAREVLAVQVAVQLGDTGVADRARQLAGLVEGPRAPLVARYAGALADEDGVGLDAVSTEFSAMGDLLAAADAAAQAANCHRRADRRGSALTASARARALAARCGGAISPALAAAAVPLPFTRREHEIAQLLARGMSNRAIADAMTLSLRTVQGHVYQACAKAGVSSRTDLATLIQGFGESDGAT